MRHKSLMWIFIGCLAASFTSSVTNAEYLLTPIADTDQAVLDGFAGTIDSIQGATLNESGQVVFIAFIQLAAPPPCLSNGTNVVAVGDGNSVTALTDPTSSFHPFGFPTGINEAGQTSFLGQQVTEIAPGSCEVGPTGIYRGEIGAVTRIADESIFDGINQSFSQLDASGTVTFVSRGSVRNGIYQGDGTESVFDDYTVVEENPSGAGLPTYDERVAVNESGEVAYIAYEADGIWRLSRSGPSGTVTIAQTGDAIEGAPGPILDLSFPAINDSGRVAFFATLSPPGSGRFGVFIGDGNSIQTVYLDTPPDVELSSSLVSINNDDAVLIAGSFDGQEALYVVQNQNFEQVVKVGDPLLGSTISSFYVHSPALNDAGQVAFFAEVAGGPDAIVRADPIVAQAVPGLSWIPIGGLAVLLAALGSLRLARIELHAARF